MCPDKQLQKFEIRCLSCFPSPPSIYWGCPISSRHEDAVGSQEGRSILGWSRLCPAQDRKTSWIAIQVKSLLQKMLWFTMIPDRLVSEASPRMVNDLSWVKLYSRWYDFSSRSNFELLWADRCVMMNVDWRKIGCRSVKTRTTASDVHNKI